MPGPTSVQFPLAAGEQLLWSGVPRQGLALRPSDALAIPFSLLWGGFAVFWESTVVTARAPWLFKLWGIPFVLVGLYITVGRFFWDARRRRDTTYGVTTQRILIAARGFAPSLQSLNIGTVTDIALNESPDGTGTITFGRPAVQAWGRSTRMWTGKPDVPSFEMIPAAKKVYDTIRDAQQGATTRAR